MLFLARSTVGRLVQSYSTDGGDHWNVVVPSDLSSSESPALMGTLPKTRDLLIIWNQISREEIRRGRISSAISIDGRHSWGKFKTLELSEGLEDRDRVPPEFPIKMLCLTCLLPIVASARRDPVPFNHVHYLSQSPAWWTMLIKMYQILTSC